MADFDVVAENSVVADLERADTGFSLFALFKFLQETAAVLCVAAVLVELGAVAAVDNPAVANGRRRGFGNGAVDLLNQRGIIFEPVAAGKQNIGGNFFERAADFGKDAQGNF